MGQATNITLDRQVSIHASTELTAGSLGAASSPASSNSQNLHALHHADCISTQFDPFVRVGAWLGSDVVEIFPAGPVKIKAQRHPLWGEKQSAKLTNHLDDADGDVIPST